MSFNHLILCCPLLPLPSIFQGLFQRVGSLYQVAKVLELSYRRLQPIEMSRFNGEMQARYASSGR